MKLSPRRWILAIAGLGLAMLILIQLIPLGRNHQNPPAGTEPAWDSPRTRELVQDACYDCHSNHTEWPWYSNVAPMSWLVYNDVMEAREVFNFNEISPEQGKGLVELMVGQVSEAKMPPLQYQAIHPEARFSSAERQELIDGLRATFK